MVHRVLTNIGKAFEQLWGFLLLMVKMPTVRSAPNPAKAAAKRVREASHVNRAATMFSGTSYTDKVLGKELAEGHKTTVYGDPMSERPIVSYGDRAPLQRRKPSRLVTVLLVLVLVVVVIAMFSDGFCALPVGGGVICWG